VKTRWADLVGLDCSWLARDSADLSSDCLDHNHLCVKTVTRSLSVVWDGGMAAILCLASTLITDSMLAWGLGRNSGDRDMMVIGAG
jgi:hypothetical protein